MLPDDSLHRDPLTLVDPLFQQAATYFQSLQDRIVAALETLDGGKFRHDDWQREEPRTDPQAPHSPLLGGFGRTRVLDGGQVLERAGVNFSQVHGRFSPQFAATMPGEGLEFVAAGISLVLHPRSPFIPTVHMNYRRLARQSGGWFGGGADLTPNYFNHADAQHFHATWRDVCQQHQQMIDWPTLKSDCDQYFQLPHRQEARGIGGIFFDHRADAPQAMFDFVQAAGDAFLPSWLPIAQRHLDDPYTERERHWQLLRRGRYVEFNLVVDRGTIFGLKTGGRIESILMSLPAEARWQYDVQPPANSPEAQMQEVLRHGFTPT